MAQPVNDTQRKFEQLCKDGGGASGGPPLGKVLELLKFSGQKLNVSAYQTLAEQMEALPDANPWHVCFAMGLSWGHLAKTDTEFTRRVCAVLSDWNDDDLNAARSFFMERGPDPIRDSLVGGYSLFQKVTLPPTLPSTLDQLDTAQQRWLSPVLQPKSRPKYIGSWNSTAMFMVALFAQPALAKTQKTHRPLLPPGGPVFAGLKMLHAAKILKKAPDGGPLDDQAFEPGSLYLNNSLFSELVASRDDWCLLDVHSGIYMLGTRHLGSDNW